MRWFRRYFNYSKFPSEAKRVLTKALRAEALFLGLLGVLFWRLTYLHDITYALGGKYIQLVGGPTYGSDAAAAKPTWESFLISPFADRLGLTAAKIEIEIIWALFGAIVLAFGAYILKLDWRKPREEHYRPTVYLLTVLNWGIALWLVGIADSAVTAVIVTAAELLVLVFFVLRPTAKTGWQGRV